VFHDVIRLASESILLRQCAERDREVCGGLSFGYVVLPVAGWGDYRGNGGEEIMQTQQLRRRYDPEHWPDPEAAMLKTPEFEAVWQCIQDWDINVPGAYSGYCGATGNHVRAILDALTSAGKK
jgi:hypothetical protein